MTINSRRKGRRGESEFKNLLKEKDWVVHDLTSGDKCEDFIATDPRGRTWSVECKNTIILKILDFLKRARHNAKRSKKPWLLAMKLPRHDSSWLIYRKGRKPTVWNG